MSRTKLRQVGAEGGIGLQVTQAARSAELVLEDADGEATRRAEVYVYGFDDLPLVVDAEQVSTADRAEFVAAAARDTDSIYQGGKTRLVNSGGTGYAVSLPGYDDAGFQTGDKPRCTPAHGVILIHPGVRDRLARDLKSIREDQAQ